MSGRMTKDEADKAWVEFPFHGDGDAWAEPVAAEFWRARSEEARLLEEATQKDEEIERLRRLLGEAQAERTHIANVAEWREGQVTQKDASIAALEEQQRALILRTHSQDATIATLADALKAMRAAFPHAYASQEEADAADAADAALRLTGRLA